MIAGLSKTLEMPAPIASSQILRNSLMVSQVLPVRYMISVSKSVFTAVSLLFGLGVSISDRFRCW